MTDLKCVYTFNEDEQYLTVEFLLGESDTMQYSWRGYVFDENWSDLISSAASISAAAAECIEYAYDSLGIRGRIAFLTDLTSVETISSILETSLFHMQGLLYVTGIFIMDELDSLENFGFNKEKLPSGKSLYFLASDTLSDDSCRFL
jgi:hypothetical protein